MYETFFVDQKGMFLVFTEKGSVFKWTVPVQATPYLMPYVML